jgi:hypothetical protein
MGYEPTGKLLEGVSSRPKLVPVWKVTRRKSLDVEKVEMAC